MNMPSRCERCTRIAGNHAPLLCGKCHMKEEYNKYQQAKALADEEKVRVHSEEWNKKLAEERANSDWEW